MTDSPSKYKSVREWVEARRRAQNAVAPPPPPLLDPPSSLASSKDLSEDSGLVTTGALRISTQGDLSFGHARRFEVGSHLGNYLLTEQIGRGGTALVFRALHRTLKKPVALKVLHAALSDGSGMEAAQLRREAELLAKFDHPSVVRVLDFDDSAEMPFLVMELVDGMSLQELLGFSGRLRPDKAAGMLLQVAEGLSAAHTLGIVHRDVKPGNILLARDGTVRLADLGLAFTQHVGDGLTSSLTGTVAYVSPEQATPGSEVDHRSDVYSLGATFYHAVTGETPFKGRSRMEVLYKLAQEQPLPPHAIVAGLPARVSDVILKMMAKDPAQRYQTYDELITDLKALRNNEPTPNAAPRPVVLAEVEVSPLDEADAPPA